MEPRSIARGPVHHAVAPSNAYTDYSRAGGYKWGFLLAPCSMLATSCSGEGISISLAGMRNDKQVAMQVELSARTAA